MRVNVRGAPEPAPEPGPSPAAGSAGVVTVRYWAAARAAAGTDVDLVETDGSTTVAEVVRRVVGRHGPDFARVVTACSALVGDRPAGGAPTSRAPVEAGQTVELLPPFAGG